MSDVAREKGKSRRRIRDWHQRFQAGEDVEDDAARRQRLAPKAVKLGDQRFAASQEDLEDLATAEGMVVAVFRRGATVRVGGEPIFCGIAKTFRAPEGTSPLAVGDNVTVGRSRPEHTDGRRDLDRNRMDGMILARHPRETVLARPQPRSQKRRDKYGTETFEKAIAVNMNVMLIVASVREPPLRPRLIERFLIVAERGELAPVIAINKIDLGLPKQQVVSDFSALGVRVLLCSALERQGLDELQAALGAKRSVLVGASGVGKSALINAMVPGADAATRTVRPKDQRGRHTTAAATIYDLPGGGILVDTPGVRELGLDLHVAELPWYFPEFEAFAQDCKFNDCTHTHEPDCAVLAAVKEGKILPRRYNSYLRLLESIKQEPGA